jgi:hypothetical protein
MKLVRCVVACGCRGCRVCVSAVLCFLLSPAPSRLPAPPRRRDGARVAAAILPEHALRRDAAAARTPAVCSLCASVRVCVDGE